MMADEKPSESATSLLAFPESEVFALRRRRDEIVAQVEAASQGSANRNPDLDELEAVELELALIEAMESA